jgi:hypothetical protein
MADFKTIINHFNKMEIANIFTSTEMKATLMDVIKTPNSVSSFLTTAHKMGVVEKHPIENRIGRGAKFNFMKVRSVTKNELHKLTTRPICFEFKKEIDRKFIQSIAGVTKPRPVRKKIQKKNKQSHHRKTVSVKSHQRIKRSKKTVSITEHPDKTIITIYK